MRSDSRRRIVAKLLAEAEAGNSEELRSLPESEEASSPSEISPESILETSFVGLATVRFLAGDVRSLDIASSASADSAAALVIFPAIAPRSIEGPTSFQGPGVQQFCVILAPEIVLRLVSLGIENLADHLRDKRLQVSGTIEKQAQEPPLTGLIYRIWVNSLDQLVSVEKPVEGP